MHGTKINVILDVTAINGAEKDERKPKGQMKSISIFTE